MAQWLDQTQSYVSKLERGERASTYMHLVWYCRALGFDATKVITHLAEQRAAGTQPAIEAPRPFAHADLEKRWAPTPKRYAPTDVRGASVAAGHTRSACRGRRRPYTPHELHRHRSRRNPP